MGFAQEMKDFLSASQSTIKTLSDSNYKTSLQKQAEEATAKSFEERNDPTNIKINEEKLAGMIARRHNTEQATRSQRLIDTATTAALNSPPVPTAAAAVPVTTDQPLARGAAPILAAPEPTGTGYSRGGMVKKYDDGGLVDDEEEETPLPQQVTSAPAVGGMSTDISARRRAPPPLPMDTGVIAGMKHLAETSGIGQEAITPALREQAVNRYARGAGGAPAADMSMVFKKVDPEGKMPESVRNLNAINSVYNFYTQAGDQTKAKAAAAQMLQYYRTASSQYMAIAKAAAGDGNMDVATKALMKSYANIPDGKDAKLWVDKDKNIGYTIKNADGSETHSGIMSPQKFGGMLMKVSPADFDRHLLTAAGEKYADTQSQPIAKPGKKAAVGGEGADIPKVNDQGTLQEQVGTHVDTAVEAMKKKNPAMGEKITDEETTAMKNAMFHIRRNNDVTNDEAFRAAQSYITAPEPKKKGDAMPFKVTKGEDTATIKYADGRVVELPMSDYLPLAALRGKALEDKAKADAKATEDAKKETYGQIAGRAGTAALDIAKDAGKAVSAVGEAVGGVASRAGEAISEDAGKFSQETITAAKKFEELNPAAAAAIKRGASAVGRIMTNPDDEDRRVDAPL